MCIRDSISTVKLLADGSLGARTAFLREPYSDAPDTCGLPIYPEQAQLDLSLIHISCSATDCGTLWTRG